MRKIFLLLTLNFLIIFFISCSTEKDKASPEEKGKSELTQFELENGIGPVKEKLVLGEIDPKLVKKGEELWNTKCTICHKLDEKYLGPPQGNVLERRSPEFVMNMLLNPEGMEEKHPEIKKLIMEYNMRMPNQNLTYDDARAILEFLRSYNKK
ncbi:MAG: cytochrome c [Ignavibacterium sp.]|nr:cytochrome c [Ignavibacterium sp.]